MGNVIDEFCGVSSYKNTDYDIVLRKTPLSKMNFRTDLQDGLDGEQYVKNALENSSIEVKRDKWVTRSGNICLEFSSRNKPSGILVTKADFWCFIVGEAHMLIMPTKFLKWIHENNFGQVKAVGDVENGKPTSLSRLISIKNELIPLMSQYQSVMGM